MELHNRTSNTRAAQAVFRGKELRGNRLRRRRWTHAGAAPSLVACLGRSVAQVEQAHRANARRVRAYGFLALLCLAVALLVGACWPREAELSYVPGGSIEAARMERAALDASERMAWEAR